MRKCAFAALSLVAGLSLATSSALPVSPARAAANTNKARASAYFDTCARQYNAGKLEEAVSSCDKAITLDPTKADAYFIKGSVLFGNGKIGHDGKIEAPDAVKALKKYLKLAPKGGHAQESRAMLDALR